MSLNHPLPLRPVLLLGPLPTAAGHVSASKLAKTCVTRCVADKTARAREAVIDLRNLTETGFRFMGFMQSICRI